MDAKSKDIKIPGQHYVGFQARTHEDLPLGFMTPDGTDKAAQKRKATVDGWATHGSGYSGSGAKTLEPQSYENQPMSGFKLGKNIRHGYGWGQGNIKWRIEDPRGFELEITSPNLAQVIAFTTIENGEILDKCIWGRLGADNILIPVSSDVYQAASVNTERVSKKASLKDLAPGNHIIMHNGEEGIYLGSHYALVGGSYCGKVTPRFQDKKKHFYSNKDTKGKVTIHSVSSPKISEIREDECTYSPIEAEKVINDYLKVTGNYVSSSGYSDTILSVSNKVPKDFKISLIPTTFDDIQSNVKPSGATHFYGRQFDHKVGVIELGGLWGAFSPQSLAGAIEQYESAVKSHAARAGTTHSSWYGTPRRQEINAYLFDKNQLDTEQAIITQEEDYSSHYGRSSTRNSTFLLPQEGTSGNFYKVQYEFTDSNGEHYSHVL